MKNYHTHTFRCKHAVGNVADYCQSAIDKGFSELGFSDHTALPDNRWLNVRMSIDELPDYSSDIDKAQKDYSGLKIFKGAECEYAPEYLSYYTNELLGKYKFDYLVGGAHYFPVNGEWQGCYGAENTMENLHAYTDYVIKSMSYKPFRFIAHPDLFYVFYQVWDKESLSCSKAILQAALDTETVLEINGYGFRKELLQTPGGLRRPYPCDPFWELAGEYDISVIYNSDAHDPRDIDKFGGAMDMIRAYDLTLTDMKL